MANIAKIGLDYFPMDVNMFSDIKIRKLIKYQSCNAISVYNVLLCQIYQNGYFLRWDDDSAFIITELLGINEEEIVIILECCLNIGIFSRTMFDKYQIVTSAGIQKRYEKISKEAKRKNQITEYSLINTEEIVKTSEEKAINAEEIPKSTEEKTQSKVKESKVKERKEQHLLQIENLEEAKEIEILVQKINETEILQVIPENKEPKLPEIDDVIKISNLVWKDKKWLEVFSMQYRFKKESNDFFEWMKLFNLSLSTTEHIYDLTERRYKALFGGWLSKKIQQGKTLKDYITLSNQPEKLLAPPLTRV